MACFLVPMAEAVVVDVIRKKVPSMNVCRLDWLSQLLWGVSLLLMLEHAWTGEVTLSFPFLTALSNPESAVVMVHELLTVGFPTAFTVTFIWSMITAASFRMRGATRLQA